MLATATIPHELVLKKAHELIDQKQCSVFQLSKFTAPSAAAAQHGLLSLRRRTAHIGIPALACQHLRISALHAPAKQVKWQCASRR